MEPGPTLALVVLAVHDLARATRFYREIFGWPQTVDAPVYAELLMPDGRRLGLYVADAYGRNTGISPTLPPPQGVSPAELYFQTDDPATLLERLRAAGARVLSPLAPRAWGDEAAYVADPDGHVIVAARPLPSPPR
ncbi:MAG: VOC family protein [Polyangiales bacterium]